MFDLILENAAGDQLSFGMGSPFTITEIEGLYPASATINTSEMALMDGAKFDSAKVNMRVLNVAFAIEYDAAKNRIEVFKVLKPKHPVKLIYNGQYRQVYIEGYVESMPISYFDMKQIVTCSIICPSPYFKAAQEVINELRNVISAFHFPFSSTADPQIVLSYFATDVGITVENDGDVECGMVIELYAYDSIENPKVYNYVTQDFIGLDITMQAGDLITINTNAGQKKAILLRAGVESSVFNCVIKDSTWLQLEPNGSTFVYEVGTGNASNLNVTFKHFNLYEGV